MHYLYCSIMGYLFGSINPAYIISKIKGFDIREKGSGNAGASNTAMVIGKKAALVVALFDIFKAYIAVIIASSLFPHLRLAKTVTGVSCILGHIFPFMMHFHGGKGLASLGGFILGLNPKLFLYLLLFELIIGLAVDYICVVPISASVILTVICALTTSDPVATLILSVLSLIILYKHIENIRRIIDGTEAHISFLWHKEQEIERIKSNM